jgi:hypothetical protein
VDIRRNFQGDWTLESETPYEKTDAHKVKFIRPLKARQREKFTYVLTTRFGLNQTR